MGRPLALAALAFTTDCMIAQVAQESNQEELPA